MKFPLISRRNLLGSASLLAVGGALAQPTSSKTTTLVLSTPPGGAVDVLGRELAARMGQILGTTIIVESKAGASGMLAAQAVARSPADGHTLLLTHSTPILYMPHLFPKIAYDVTRDLKFVTQICEADLVLVVNKDVPVKNLREFLQWAAANRGKVSYGSYSTGSAGHLLSEYLSISRNLEMTHAPYKGEGPMLRDIMGGQISWGLSIFGSAAAHVASGRMRALAVTGPRRFPQMPDVPTFTEAGLRDDEFQVMGGILMLMPAGVPTPVADKIEAAAREAVASTGMKARFQLYGLRGTGDSSANTRKAFDDSSPIIAKLVKASGVKLD
jgi:tripartite-type tricarboxylate transporter receptor subunit TctC